VTLQQPLVAHHPLRALAIDRHPQLAAGQRGHHPRAIGRVVLRGRNDRPADRAKDRPRALITAAFRRQVDRLAGDLHHARHRRDLAATGNKDARPGDALAHSQPRNVLDRPIAAQAGEHDLKLLLGAELAVLALGCQLDLLRSSGPCCESPRTSDLSQLSVNAGAGSRPNGFTT
jgi:hypothetical protein